MNQIYFSLLQRKILLGCKTNANFLVPNRFKQIFLSLCNNYSFHMRPEVVHILVNSEKLVACLCFLAF